MRITIDVKGMSAGQYLELPLGDAILASQDMLVRAAESAVRDFLVGNNVIPGEVTVMLDPESPDTPRTPAERAIQEARALMDPHEPMSPADLVELLELHGGNIDTLIERVDRVEANLEADRKISNEHLETHYNTLSAHSDKIANLDNLLELRRASTIANRAHADKLQERIETLENPDL